MKNICDYLHLKTSVYWKNLNNVQWQLQFRVYWYNNTNKRLVPGVFKELQIPKEMMNDLMEKWVRDTNGISWKRK